MRTNRTIVGQRDKQEKASERLMARQKAKNKKIISVIITVGVLLVLFMLAVMMVREWMRPAEVVVVQAEEYAPTVEILDEDSSGYITERMKQYVGRVERDFKDAGYKVTRAIIPAGKTREVDIYVEGRTEYYKMNLDRGTAVSVEDAVRMIEYLSERAIAPSYVDVRIAGKAYYK
ncbi:hypothetical protein IJG73_02165 [Candidatus Saccharibacteria bacterium]|nr:hypothetical protein [Candidatus Saccharibacteria bacterium]